MAQYPFSDRLRQLPLRAIMALLSRCARRIRPLLPREGDAGEPMRRAFDGAIRAADRYATGELDIPDLSDEVFSFANHQFMQGNPLRTGALVARAASEAVAVGVFSGPMQVENALFGESVEPNMQEVMVKTAGEAVLWYSMSLPYNPDKSAVDPSWIDYQALLSANLGTFPTVGETLDPSDAGPLGVLWPDGAPAWFRSA